jgi:hypothetical protein
MRKEKFFEELMLISILIAIGLAIYVWPFAPLYS